MPEHTDSAGGYYKESPLALGGCWAYEKPKFDKNRIHFNGSNGLPRIKRFCTDERTGRHTGIEWLDRKSDDENLNGLDHETFNLQRRYTYRDRFDDPTEAMQFAFCKTARKPYDLMVCACLILAKHHLKDAISISSDGDYEDWKPAVEFVVNTIPSLKGRIMEVLLGDLMTWLREVA